MVLANPNPGHKVSRQSKAVVCKNYGNRNLGEANRKNRKTHSNRMQQNANKLNNMQRCHACLQIYMPACKYVMPACKDIMPACKDIMPACKYIGLARTVYIHHI